MSSILADQHRPRIWPQMRGDGGCGVSANEYSCVQYMEPKCTLEIYIVTTYLTYECGIYATKLDTVVSYQKI